MHFSQNPDLNFADSAYTLQIGRSRHHFRRALVASSAHEAAEALSSGDSPAILRQDSPFENPGVVFCFPGQGVQSLGMGRKLYESEPVFRDALDRCSEILAPAARRKPARRASIRLTLRRKRKPGSIRRSTRSRRSSPSNMRWPSSGSPGASGPRHGGTQRRRIRRRVPRRGLLARRRPAPHRRALPPDAGSAARLHAGGAQGRGYRPGSMPQSTGNSELDLDLAAVNSPQLCVVSGPRRGHRRLHPAAGRREDRPSQARYFARLPQQHGRAALAPVR